MPKQTVTVEIFYDGAWQDVTALDDVLTSAPIVVRRGQGDESNALRPCALSLRLDNTDDRYRISNPMSPLYGKVGRNTPIRVTVGSSIRCVAEMSSMQPDQTQDFRANPKRGSAWVDVQAAGVLQRVLQWTRPPRSALYDAVALSGVTPVETWPMEDPAGSAGAVSAVGGAPMVPVTVVRYTMPDGSAVQPGGAPRFADGAGVPGSAPLVSFQGGGGTLTAPVRTATFNGYAIDWVMQFQDGTDAGGTASVNILQWRETGTYVQFTVNVTSTSVTVFHGTVASLPGFAGSATASFTPFDGAAHHYRYQVRQNGGNYDATLYVDGGKIVAPASNFVPPMAGTVGVPTRIEWNPLDIIGDSLPIAAGHLTIWPSGQVGAQPAAFNATNGRLGERTSFRWDRILTERGVPHVVATLSAFSSKMGPQRPDTIQGNMIECAATEDALIFDRRDTLGLYFWSSDTRYNQTPFFDLSPTDLPDLPREVVDDLPISNVIVASQRQGGDTTAADRTGPLGTLDPPNGAGEKQRTIDVNVQVEQYDLPQIANWWLRKGTVDIPRYPQLVVNLAALSPDRVAAIEGIDIGCVFTISGFRENTLRLQVVGYTETIGTHSRKIVFNVVPDQQFDVGAYGPTTAAKQRLYDSASTVLKVTVGNSDTSLKFRTTSIYDIWSTSGVPYNVMIGGELMRVTSMSAASLVSGFYEQDATVLRSLNGVVKGQAAAQRIRVSPQGIYAL